MITIFDILQGFPSLKVLILHEDYKRIQDEYNEFAKASKISFSNLAKGEIIFEATQSKIIIPKPSHDVLRGRKFDKYFMTNRVLNEYSDQIYPYIYNNEQLFIIS